MYGNFTNNSSTFVPPSVVRLMGSGTQIIDGSSPTTFYNLILNKQGSVQLNQDITATYALRLTSGSLNAGISHVTLGPAATLIETLNYRVTGWVETSRPVASGARETFGSLGLALTRAAASVEPGTVRVVRVTGTALAGTGSVANARSIQRYYDIIPANNAGLDMTMEFGYLDQELNGVPENNLVLFRSTTGTGGPWQNRGFTSRDATANTVTLSGISAFSVWTLGNSAAPLPVELTDFTAVAQGPTAVRLAWHTASEQSSDYFAVERSPDGVAFAEVGRVAAAGTSTTPRTYGLLDATLRPQPACFTTACGR
ncbi:MAG: hypothetical protein ACRYFX_00725 [Janthinobacterium lividum]